MKKLTTLIAASTALILSAGANAQLNEDGSYTYSNTEYCQYIKSIKHQDKDDLAKVYKRQFVKLGGDRAELTNSKCNEIVKAHGRLSYAEIQKLRQDITM
ncbi:hypothetical protein H5203_21990 [Pseudoalteromonas sp. SG41-1]|uniref:hypothetical protein n=1 Tax=Pseudoalteromonas sp. SG41-1 TaxID=2760979 RepID=UPI00160018B1|nr:hypothetical protein [Pseudoalteromonas sp. SG41-1]MBB1508108.1 hypothetical protein [Pseudoalteromonas sp. SG41-1]